MSSGHVTPSGHALGDHSVASSADCEPSPNRSERTSSWTQNVCILDNSMRTTRSGVMYTPLTLDGNCEPANAVRLKASAKNSAIKVIDRFILFSQGCPLFTTLTLEMRTMQLRGDFASLLPTILDN